METTLPTDSVLAQQTLMRRQNALALLAKTRFPSTVAVQLPVWLALCMVLLILLLPAPKPNPVPYIAGMLGFAIAWAMAMIVRVNRRLDAIVQLIT
jgi:hypothetical protein